MSKEPSWFDDFLSGGSPFHAGLSVGETFDDNIFISPQKTSDFITHISPSVEFKEGDISAPNSNYFDVSFTPTLFLYEDHSDQNRTDYDVNAIYQHQFTRLTLGIEQRYQHLTDATIDIGNLADRDIYTTVLGGNYAYDDKLTLIGTATQRITDYSTGSNVDTNEWVLDAYSLYQVAPKLELGLGPRVAFIDILGAPNERHEDALFHLKYNPGGKINAIFSGGVEYLEFQNNSPSHVLPIFDFTLNYDPFDGTELSLTGFRQSVSSYDEAGETYLNTIIQVSLKQRFLRDFYFKLSAAYNMSDYQFGSEPATGVERKDNYYFANVGIEWDPRKWLMVSARYQYSEDDSTLYQNSFNDNQVDIQSSVKF